MTRLILILTSAAFISAGFWKFRLQRLACIPVLILFPLSCTLSGNILGEDNSGDSFPLFSMLGFFLGTIASVVIAIVTVFSSQKISARNRAWSLTIAFVFTAAAPVAAQATLSWIAGPVRSRASVRLEASVPAQVNISGLWMGSWTDPRNDQTATLTLSMEQFGNVVSGTVKDDYSHKWKISDGLVSGDQIDLLLIEHWDLEKAGITFRGRISNDTIAGEYHRHAQIKGGASSGTWIARRIPSRSPISAP